MKVLRLFALSLLFSVTSAFAQDATPEAAPPQRGLMQIIEVLAEVEGENILLNVRAATTNECGEPQVEILEDTDELVVIDLYSEAQDDVDCETNEHTVEIPLQKAIPPMGLFIDINGLPYLINPDGTFGAAFVAPVAITDLTPAVEEDALVISVVGEIDGCEVPVITRRVVEDGAVNVRLYRILSAAMTCPAVLVEYTEDIEIPLKGDEMGLWVIAVNDVEIGYDFDQGTVLASEDLFRVDAVIESIEVNTSTRLPRQVMMTLNGYHADSCVVPTQIRQEFDVPTNTLTVHVYRVLSIAQTCLAEPVEFSLTVPLEMEIIEGTTYTINANGTTTEVTF
jgi:hypothetical protein